MDDKIEEDQPLFSGVSFERPMNTSAGTSCGQSSAGCIHGTEVAGMAVATGNATCGSLCTADTGTEKGAAYGVAHVLDADFGTMPDAAACAYDSALWAFGFSQPPIGSCTHSMPGATHPAYVHSDSHGGYTAADDSAFEQNLDKFTSAFGAVQTEPSGNDGVAAGGSGRITDSCIAYDVICAGGISAGDPTTSSDDAMTTFSSPGPSPAGRKKPDLVAVAAGSGSTNMTVAEQLYIANNRLERGDTGTSFASPQVAGGAALLYGAGVTDPLVIKAILLDSTTLGRATSASAMGTQTMWQPDWGWGELNLDAAYQQRDDFAAESVPAQGVRFYRATVNAGDRATLVWNRRVIGAPDQTAAPDALTLSNLDLYEYDSLQTQQAVSDSTIDNVEQVRGTAAGTVVYKVKDESSVVDGQTTEPFALAARDALTPLAAPAPSVTVTLDRASGRQGDDFTVTETVRNTSADMSGTAASATLNLPTGISVTSGGSTTWSPGGGTLSADGTDSHQWSVRATADGSYAIGATAQQGAYAETFSAADHKTLRVDSAPPTPSISCPMSGGTNPNLAIDWSAEDSSGIASYDVDVAVDGGPFSPWLTGTNLTSSSYPGVPGGVYSLRVRATDVLGNQSGYVSCGPVAIGFVVIAPVNPVSNPPRALPSRPHLKLAKLHVRKHLLEIVGRLARRATGTVRCTYSTKNKRYRARSRVRHGRYRLIVRFGRRRWRPGLLRIDYSGDRAFAPQHISRRVK